MAATLKAPVIDLKLVPADSGRRPGGLRRQPCDLVHHKVKGRADGGHGILHPEDELHMQRFLQQSFIRQAQRLIQHGKIEDLDFRLHLVFQHFRGQFTDKVRRILVNDCGEIARARGERGHVAA